MVKTEEKRTAKKKPAKLKGDLIVADGSSGGGSRRKRDDSDGSGVSDAVLHFLQSPLVADLLAVAATAALAALAEHRFSSKSGGEAGRKKAAGKAVKAAGVAAAAAIGRRLSEEFEEIKKASKPRDREASAQEA